MAGPDVIRNGAPSSAARIIASVVLPSPGEPDSRTWSGGRPRCCAARSSRRRTEPVLELEDEPLSALATDARHESQRTDVVGRDRGAHGIRRVDSEHGLRELRSDTGHRLKNVEDDAFVVTREAEQRQ